MAHSKSPDRLMPNPVNLGSSHSTTIGNIYSIRKEYGHLEVFWYTFTKVDRRAFKSRGFHAYVSNTRDEEYLKGYYNLMNFSGTIHTENQKAY